MHRIERLEFGTSGVKCRQLASFTITVQLLRQYLAIRMLSLVFVARFEPTYAVIFDAVPCLGSFPLTTPIGA